MVALHNLNVSGIAHQFAGFDEKHDRNFLELRRRLLLLLDKSLSGILERYPDLGHY